MFDLVIVVIIKCYLSYNRSCSHKNSVDSRKLKHWKQVDYKITKNTRNIKLQN